MNFAIYDSTLGIISKDSDGPCFLVDSAYRQVIPSEDGNLLIAEIGKKAGYYAAYSNIFAKIPSEDVYAYQALLPPSDETTAIFIDRLNDKYVILTARLDGLNMGSRTFESPCSEGDFRRFCSSFGISLDAPSIEVREYGKPKKLTSFQEPQDLLSHKRKKRIETIFLSAASLVAAVGIIYFGARYIEQIELADQKNELQSSIAELSSRVPKENIEIYDKLDRDEMIIRYLKELDRIKATSLVSVTADGAVFSSHRPLMELRGINKQIKPVEAERFFLPVTGFGKLPVDK